MRIKIAGHHLYRPGPADANLKWCGRRDAVDQQRLAIIQMATRRYYDWVAAGLRFEAAQSVLKVAESGIKTAEDAARMRAAGADALLVGESLMRAADPAALMKALQSA